MPDLVVAKLGIPVNPTFTTYDITYQFTSQATGVGIPVPEYDSGIVDLVDRPTMVFNTGSQISSEDTIYTTWYAATVTLQLSNFPSPHGDWNLVDNNGYRCMVAPYGLLPATWYPTTDYDLVSVDHMYIHGVGTGHMLFNVVNGAYTVGGCGVYMRYESSKPYINYEVTLRNKNTLEEFTVTGSSIDYTVYNSPISNAMVLYMPADTMQTTGDVNGTVTMTETPRN